MITLLAIEPNEFEKENIIKVSGESNKFLSTIAGLLPTNKLTRFQVGPLLGTIILIFLNTASWIGYGCIGVPSKTDCRILFYITLVICVLVVIPDIIMNFKKTI